MATRPIDPTASKVTVRTRAKGLLSRLAHDLEILATDLSGTVEIDGEAWKTEIQFGVPGLRVVGALEGDRVNDRVLSVADKQDIERRLADAVRGRQVKVEATGTSRERGQVTVICPEGRQRLEARLRSREGAAGALEVEGSVRLSLEALGVREVKAPLGVFKLADAIEIAFRFGVKPEG